MPYSYYATLVKAVDGDTYDVDLDVGFHLTARVRTRLLDADAPEHREAGYRECRTAAVAWFAGGRVTAETTRTDDFGRWLTRYTRDDGTVLADVIRALMAEHGWTSPDVRLHQPQE